MRSLLAAVNPIASRDDDGIAAFFPELAAELPPGAAGWENSAGKPVLQLAEGLLRAPPRGGLPRPRLSALVREATGPIAAHVATPEQVLARRDWESPQLLARAAAARRALIAARIGGTWWADRADQPPGGSGLTIIEPRGSATGMSEAALADNPAAELLVLALEANPWSLLDRAARVYTDGGEFGFLALLAGVPVSAFGESFYTGWGATRDAPGVPQHSFSRSVDEIFAGACLVATRYRDPFRNAPATFEATLDLLAEWRRLDEANRRIAVCVGMSFWKRRRVADFLRSSAGAPVFRRSVAGALAAAQRAPAGRRAIAGWASRLPEGLPDAAARAGVPLIRVEDGFIRSVGLGSDFLPPASLVLDTNGMYYDPGSRSDLEVLLAEAEFSPALVARARHLAAQLVARGISKYNLAGRGPSVAVPPTGKRILVPGQVEDDLSILRGGGAVRSNLVLLREARAANPDAFILYKPHPDVLAGHRKGAVPETEARRFADMVVTEAATPALLGLVDELHTMTSLAGFEALLRGRRVVVYGRPFYAGWGLTEDRLPLERGRRLTLDELVAGALILYPRYLDPLTRLPCGPEVIVERLDHPELWRAGPLVRARRWQGAALRRLAQWRASLAAAAIGVPRQRAGR